MKIGRKQRKILLGIIVGAAALLALYLLVDATARQKPITWGVDFSQMQAEALQLDWRKAYLAIMEDLGATHIKLHTQWDWVEGVKDTYYFKDIDWQMRQAEIHNTKIIYVVGMKTGRWPECHAPGWINDLSKQEQQGEILEYIEKTVKRYKSSGSIIAWQAENEPLFKFGECPWYGDVEFLKKEVALIKSLDPGRPVIISDSGEQSWWLRAGMIGDQVGVTTYRKVWVHIYRDFGFYFTFPIPPQTYWWKARIVNLLLGKEVIGVELQAEPWLSKLFYDQPLAKHAESMNVKQFTKNVEYARRMGLGTFYLWGVEWMYWLKETHQQPEMWNEAKKLFMN